MKDDKNKGSALSDFFVFIMGTSSVIGTITFFIALFSEEGTQIKNTSILVSAICFLVLAITIISLFSYGSILRKKKKKSLKTQLLKMA